MEARRDVFQAIADPTRRQIISLVSKQALNFNSVAEQFEISRQAVSFHIRILAECGLVVIREQGRERYCEAKLENLDEIYFWVDQFKKHWEGKLDSLEKYLSKIQKNKGHAKRSK
jgi:DNA-binding transcriptional ArsR family regulator